MFSSYTEGEFLVKCEHQDKQLPLTPLIFTDLLLKRIFVSGVKNGRSIPQG